MAEQQPIGVDGLDAVLRGGLPAGRIHLVQGLPGTGKTTLALQFLIEGARRGQRALYVSLSQTRRDLERIAAAHGWSLEGIDIVELHADAGPEAPEATQSIFVTSDLKLDQTRRALEQAIHDLDPRRLVYDLLHEVRLLTPDTARYKREMVGSRSFISGGDRQVDHRLALFRRGAGARRARGAVPHPDPAEAPRPAPDPDLPHRRPARPRRSERGCAARSQLPRRHRAAAADARGGGPHPRELIAVKKRHGPHELDARELIIRSGLVDVGEDGR